MSVPEDNSTWIGYSETLGTQLYLTEEMRVVLDKLKNEWISYEIVSESDWYTLVGEKWNKEQLVAFMNAWNFSGISSIKSGAFIWSIIFDTHNGRQIPSEDMIQRSNTLDLWGTITLVNVSWITWNANDIREFCAYLPEQRKYSLTYEFPVENTETSLQIIKAWNTTRTDVRETLSGKEQWPAAWKIVIFPTVTSIRAIFSWVTKRIPGILWQNKSQLSPQDYQIWISWLWLIINSLKNENNVFQPIERLFQWKMYINDLEKIISELPRLNGNIQTLADSFWLEVPMFLEHICRTIDTIKDTAKRLMCIKWPNGVKGKEHAIKEAMTVPYMTHVAWFTQWLHDVGKKLNLSEADYAADIQNVLKPVAIRPDFIKHEKAKLIPSMAAAE